MPALDSRNNPAGGSQRPLSNSLGVIVVAGGRGSRMGGANKAALSWGGQSFLRVLLNNLSATAPAPPAGTSARTGAGSHIIRDVVVVSSRDIPADCTEFAGAAHEGTGEPTRYAAVAETPAFSGPLAAIAAGSQTLLSRPEQHNYIAVFAVDAPASPLLLPELTAAVSGDLVEAPSNSPADAVDVTLVVDSEGFRNPLCALWRAESLHAAVDKLAERDELVNGSVRWLLRNQRIAEIPATTNVRDFDTPEDLAGQAGAAIP